MSSLVSSYIYEMYKRSDTGSIWRPVFRKLSYDFYIGEFGANSDGINDDTLAVEKAIMAIQKAKSNQLSYDEIYIGTLNFEQGKDYKILGTILLPSGIVLNGNGCRFIGADGNANTTLYNDGLPSLIETAYYDGATITSNRATALGTKLVVNSGIKNISFVNANCAINAIQMNMNSFIERCTFNNVSAAMRLKSCYYLDVDTLRIANSSKAVGQYSVLMHGSNNNAVSLRKVSVSGSDIAFLLTGGANAGVVIDNCTFEESSGSGIVFSSDAYYQALSIYGSYFEAIRYAIKPTAGAGVNACDISGNFFDSCEYSVLATESFFKLSSWKNNTCADGGGIIRNIIDLSALGNEVSVQFSGKSGNTDLGIRAYPSNFIPSNQTTVEATSIWSDKDTPFRLIGKAQSALINDNKLNELPFEGGNILSKPNQVPFCTVSRAVNTLIIDTQISYDLSNVLVFNFYGATDAIAYDLKGFMFGDTVTWVTKNPVGASVISSNNGGNVRLTFIGITANVPVINVSGMVRHV